MPARPSKKQVEDATKALNTVRRDWLRRDGATAVDVGFKIKDRKLTDEVALRLHVRRKLPPEALPAHEAVNTGKGETIQGFPIDVVEAEYGVQQQGAAAPALAPGRLLEAAAVDRRGRLDPLVGGVSCGNPRITAGTIGAIVFDRETGDPCILSNWHVLAGSRAAAAGEASWQPGRADGGSDADAVATLTRFRLDRDMDAALARLHGRRMWSRDILELNPIRGIEDPALGMQVRKSGRTTGLTEGVLDGVSLTTTLDYGDGVVQTFDDQIHIVPRAPWPAVDVEISQGGDSGSAWVNEATGLAVGLHFAGETTPAPRDEHAVANRMVAVAQGLNFSFTPLFRQPVEPVDERRRDLIREIICRRFPSLCGRPVPLPQFGPVVPSFASLSADIADEVAFSRTPYYAARMPSAERAEVDALVDALMVALRE